MFDAIWSPVISTYFHLFRGEPIPRVKYTPDEVNTWRTIYTELTKIYDKYASSEFKKNLKELEKEAGYRYIFQNYN